MNLIWLKRLAYSSTVPSSTYKRREVARGGTRI
jgi:hypothetical protein